MTDAKTYVESNRQHLYLPDFRHCRVPPRSHIPNHTKNDAGFALMLIRIGPQLLQWVSHHLVEYPLP